MATYNYKARDRLGKLNTGLLQAEDLLQAKRMLSERGLFVVAVSEKRENPLEKLYLRLREQAMFSVRPEELLIFNRQLQTSYSVGVSLLQALTMISEQTESPGLKKIIGQIMDDLSEGKSLHEAMARHPRVFDEIYVNAIKAGENSGRLDEILNMLCYFSEQQMENRAKVKSATFYPKIVLAMIVIVFVVIVTFVVPKIRGFYDKMGGQLPGITLFMLSISDFFVNYWYFVAAAALGGYLAFAKVVATPEGRLRWDAFKLKIPVFGTILLQADMLSFSTVFGLLVKSGMPVIDALDTVRSSVSNDVVRGEIEICRRAVEQGKDIAFGFQQSKVIPKMVGNLISIGEESGKIDDVLQKVSAYYKLQLEYRLNNLAKAIEPAFLVLIFGVVLVLTLAVFLPIWKMSQLMRPH